MHRRDDLRVTMSEYLIDELQRFGVAVRDRTELVALDGRNGQLESVTTQDDERLSMSFLFLFLGATPCTNWLGEAITRDADGFIATGVAAGGGELLETSLPGVYAAGDARSGSVKRCATAVGEGAMVVSLVHQRLADLVA
jgi:thioredoxin reductase (NADPH)